MPAALQTLLIMVLLSPFSTAVRGEAEYPSFQKLVDATAAGGLLSPPAGTYAGPVIVTDPIIIDGRGEVTIDAGGRGSVMSLETDGATIKNMRLTNSGESHNDVDSGVLVKGNFNVIRDNVIDDTLFGIDLSQSENNIVRGNRISSKALPLGVRGDAIRLWYSFNNKITDNIIRDSRDTVVWYSKDNLIARNDARGGRYSLHFMYSQYNEVLDNHYEDNSVGIFLMYSDGVVVRGNTIAYSSGTTGMGIGFKETSDVEVSGNRILYCATGLYLDVSPFQPETTNRIEDNLIAYSGIGVLFLNDWQGNRIRGNRFKGNITQVAVTGARTAKRNDWEANYWEDYQGFDLDRDGVGDGPYEYYNYADRIWMDVPAARFFKGSPVLEVLDFLERLAPFTDPEMVLRDSRPMMSAELAHQQIMREDTAQAHVSQEAGETQPFDALKALRDSMAQ
ncbi:MAG: nitrous oxide reductase family maturation protein NosD [Chromatiaceae bacterium]|nr:nitrous oxide reductase family maturation protein NosD [Chromatiaceae bacterium]